MIPDAPCIAHASGGYDDKESGSRLIALLCSTVTVNRTSRDLSAPCDTSPPSISPACLSKMALARVASGESTKIGADGNVPACNQHEQIDEELLRPFDGKGWSNERTVLADCLEHLLVSNDQRHWGLRSRL